jgi:tripartite-type tricarboxylate transporter receptor subunit TctC
MTRISRLVFVLLVFLGVGHAMAQAYPEKPIRIVVGFPAGGASDTVIVKALAQPDLRAKLADQGLEAIGNSPEEFAAIIKSETPTWAKVIKDAAIKPD